MHVVDLSVPISNDLPVYPGDPQVHIAEVARFASDGYNDHSLHIGTHAGTHIDAPYHMIDGGKKLHEFPIDTFVGRGVYIEAADGHFDLEKVKAAGIQRGDIVVFHTGMSDKYTEPAYFEQSPSIPEDVATYLATSGAKMVGMDMCSPDGEPYTVHKILLSNDVLIIENLVHVERLADTQCTIAALPLALGVDGAPARVVALMEQA